MSSSRSVLNFQTFCMIEEGGAHRYVPLFYKNRMHSFVSACSFISGLGGMGVFLQPSAEMKSTLRIRRGGGADPPIGFS